MPFPRGEGCAECFVAPDHLLQAALQSGHIERAGDAPRYRHVVSGGSRVELRQEPQPLLSERQLDCIAQRSGHDWRVVWWKLGETLPPVPPRRRTGARIAVANSAVLAHRCRNHGGLSPRAHVHVVHGQGEVFIKNALFSLKSVTSSEPQHQAAPYWPVNPD